MAQLGGCARQQRRRNGIPGVAGDAGVKVGIEQDAVTVIKPLPHCPFGCEGCGVRDPAGCRVSDSMQQHDAWLAQGVVRELGYRSDPSSGYTLAASRWRGPVADFQAQSGVAMQADASQW